jgi:7-carboxy-7-deazaguanine synthase
MQEYDLNNKSEILFSPCMGQVEPRDLAEWVLAEKIPSAKYPIRFQLQLHKILWGDIPGK